MNNFVRFQPQILITQEIVYAFDGGSIKIEFFLNLPREYNELLLFLFLNTNCKIINTLSIHLLVKNWVASEECQICTLYLMLYTVQYL